MEKGSLAKFCFFFFLVENKCFGGGWCGARVKEHHFVALSETVGCGWHGPQIPAGW